MIDVPYTLVQEQADRINVVVLGRFLEKHPDCAPVRQEYDRCKANVDWRTKQREKHVLGTKQCPYQRKGKTHFAVQDSCAPTYRCLYCCADMS